MQIQAAIFSKELVPPEPKETKETSKGKKNKKQRKKQQELLRKLEEEREGKLVLEHTNKVAALETWAGLVAALIMGGLNIFIISRRSLFLNDPLHVHLSKLSCFSHQQRIINVYKNIQ